MSIIKSHSVGNGDMFYIKHGSDNFTIIDCYLDTESRERLVQEIISESTGKGITRFISTHPDEDHICGLKYLNEQIGIINFYCVENKATKADDSIDFNEYCKLRDSSKAFNIKKNCKRMWMNQSGLDENGEDRKSSGINILWPDPSNQHYKNALQCAKNAESPNNISVIIQYSMHDSATMLWMGDLETDFMENIQDDLELSKINILFAPHHGRKSGTIPNSLLKIMDPDIIIIGEAPSKDLNYYPGYNTICQNSAEDITFQCEEGKVHIFTSNHKHSVDFLDDENIDNDDYIGTLNL